MNIEKLFRNSEIWTASLREIKQLLKYDIISFLVTVLIDISI